MAKKPRHVNQQVQPPEVRGALDLATLRGLAAPSRRELIEAVTTVLAQGELGGRGRAVTGALEQVLIGQRSGKTAPGTPVSDLRENILTELKALKLPLGEKKQLSVEPLRNTLDLQRHVLLMRLLIGGITYATPIGAEPMARRRAGRGELVTLLERCHGHQHRAGCVTRPNRQADCGDRTADQAGREPGRGCGPAEGNRGLRDADSRGASFPGCCPAG